MWRTNSLQDHVQSVRMKMTQWLRLVKRRPGVRRLAATILVAAVALSVIGIPIRLSVTAAEPVPATQIPAQPPYQSSATNPADDLPLMILSSLPMKQTTASKGSTPTQNVKPAVPASAPKPAKPAAPATQTKAPAAKPAPSKTTPAKKTAASTTTTKKVTTTKATTTSKPKATATTKATTKSATKATTQATPKATTAKAAPAPAKAVAPAPAKAPAPTSTAPKATTPAVAANHLVVPSLGINASFSANGVVKGALVIPENPALLTRYSGGAAPCASAGTVLIAGHVSNNGKKGALYSLTSLKVGATAYLGCGNGQTSTWQMSSSYVANQDALTWDLFTSAGPNRLVLITCTGPLGADGMYHQNLVVILKRVS